MSTKTYKEIATEFLMLASKGIVREAFKNHTHPDFKHHNVFFKGDVETLMLAIEENANNSPNMIFEIKHALQDGDLVAVHSHTRENADDLGTAICHVFQFKEEKIIEVWDFGQAIPDEMVNEYGMF